MFGLAFVVLFAHVSTRDFTAVYVGEFVIQIFDHSSHQSSDITLPIDSLLVDWKLTVLSFFLLKYLF